jgi:hemoglobin
MYPESDMKGAAHRLQIFLEQYWGGPTTYQEERGHPRLRMRHAGFKIGPAAKDAWLTCMRQAVEGMEMETQAQEKLWRYLEGAAEHLLNSFED